MATVRKIEGDERRPSVQLAERLADVLAIAPHDRAAFMQSARAARAADRLPPASQLPSALPRGIVTFLFAGPDGSALQWQQYARTVPPAIARCTAIVRQAIAASGGVVFKTVEDVVQAAFAQPADALDAALAVQRALSHAAVDETDPLRVRIALHSAACEIHEGDYVGLPPGRTARLLAMAHGGQIIMSQATRQLLRDTVPAEVEFRDLGEYSLAGLLHPERIFQINVLDLPSRFPPLAALSGRQNSLPAPATPLLGREQEVADVRALLAHTGVRLVTLTGPGGVGKTRLALEVAAELIGEFADGVFMVPLAPVVEPADVAATIARVLDVQETGSQPLVERMQRFLAGKRALLLLDNSSTCCRRLRWFPISSPPRPTSRC